MSRRPWYIGKYPWLALIMVLSIGGVGAWRFFTVKADKPVYLLGSVDRGDIAIQVAASGTLSAVTTVQVGSQVSGNIAELYADYNSEVKRGQLLARLDPQLFETQVRQSEANVRTSEMTLSSDLAGIASAKANLEKAKVDVKDKQRKFNRQKELYEDGLIASDDFDTAQAALQAAVATQNAAEAQLQSAEAGYKADEARLQQARAGLQTAKVNLEHTMIYSPIAGTIISRSVDRGQTVAASMSAPTLFNIGEDLTKMQIITNIDEADVGRIRTGLQASFTVDAYPDEVFTGTISQIRLAATTVQNVVTYNAIFGVENPQQRLKPGMTANVKILIEEVNDALKIPNSAIRFKPTLTQKEMEDAFRQAGEEGYWSFNKSMPSGAQNSSVRSSAQPVAAGQTASSGVVLSGDGRRGSQSGVKAPDGGGSGPGQSGAPGLGQNGQKAGKQVPIWVLAADRSLRPVVVQVGLSDGLSTQLLSGNLRQGDKIVTGLEVDSKRTAAVSTTTQPQKSTGAPPPPPPM
jgi:HlyD family secretion protein